MKIFLIPLLILTGCMSNTGNSVKSIFDNEQIRATYYHNNTNDSVEFVRFLKDSSDIKIISGLVTFRNITVTKQVITNIDTIDYNDFAAISEKLINSGFRSEFDNFRKVMFVQMKPDSISNLKLQNLRLRIEDKIEKELFKNGVGEWFAGDMGPGGANMLYYINNWDKAFELTIRLLEEEGLIDCTIIAKRLTFSAGEWNYEIVYPDNYEGDFNSR